MPLLPDCLFSVYAPQQALNQLKQVCPHQHISDENIICFYINADILSEVMVANLQCQVVGSLIVHFMTAVLGKLIVDLLI